MPEKSGPKSAGGGCCAPFRWGGELGPHLTQCGLGPGLPAYQVSSGSIQQFGHNTPTSQTDRTDRQRRQGEQTVAQKPLENVESVFFVFFFYLRVARPTSSKHRWRNLYILWRIEGEKRLAAGCLYSCYNIQLK